MNSVKIAVLVPCHNEALSIKKVIGDFRRALPAAEIYVYDNNSTDNTREVALNAGAIVRQESRKGKGNVVRRMFSDIDADAYLLVDGDDTYDSTMAPKLIEMLTTQQLDMVVATRSEKPMDEKYQTYRFGHRFGNSLFTFLIGRLFGKAFTDVFSGYRAFSKKFVKSFPALSEEFEIETELTVHSLELRMPTAEIETFYQSRPEGSVSKLRSYRDGTKILLKILALLKEVRPLFFFGCISIFFCLISLILFYPILIEYLHTGLVRRFPTAILSTGLMLIASMSLVCGVILDSVAKGKKEIKRLIYLNVS